MRSLVSIKNVKLRTHTHKRMDGFRVSSSANNCCRFACAACVARRQYIERMTYVLSVLLCESVSASVFVRSVRLRWPPSNTYMHDRSPCKQSHSFPVRFLPVAHNKNKQFNQLGTVYRWCGTRIRIRSSILVVHSIFLYIFLYATGAVTVAPRIHNPHCG